MTPGSGVLVHGRDHISHIVKMHYFFKCKYKISFHDPGAGVLMQERGHISYIVKMHYFFKNLLLFTQAWIRQTESKVYNDDQGRVYKNCKLNHPRCRGFCAGAWSYREHAIFLLLFLSSLGHGSDKLRVMQYND